MARPLYESADDREREFSAISKLARLGNKTPLKLPLRYGVDFAMYDGRKITAWIEVKCRKNEHRKYPTLMISAGKLIHGLFLSTNTKIPFFLVVEWTDAIGFLCVSTLESFRVGFGGRVDRGDEQDMEPVFHIPVDAFRLAQGEKGA